MNLQKVINGQKNRDNFFAVGASSNSDDYPTLLKFKIANGIDYNLATFEELGYLYRKFSHNFMFIGKNNKIIGNLSDEATPEEMDDMLKRTMASFDDIYLFKGRDRLLLTESTVKIDLGKYFTYSDLTGTEVSIFNSTNPTAAQAFVQNNELVVNRSSTPGYTRVTVQVQKPGKQGYVRTVFEVINPSLIYENFEIASLTDSDISFVSSGDLPWVISYEKSFMGKKSLRSGYIKSGQKSVIETNLELAEPGTLVFAYSTFTKYPDNVLNFYIDNTLLTQADQEELWYGENDWRVYTYNVRAGSRNLKWEFARGPYEPSESDAAWIDMVVLPDKNVKYNVSVPADNTIKMNSYPNPFNPVTEISFVLPENGPTELMVFDVKGKLVSEIHNGNLEKGMHKFSFDGSGLSSGLYYSVLKYGNIITTGKMILTK